MTIRYPASGVCIHALAPGPREDEKLRPTRVQGSAALHTDPNLADPGADAPNRCASQPAQPGMQSLGSWKDMPLTRQCSGFAQKNEAAMQAAHWAQLCASLRGANADLPQGERNGAFVAAASELFTLARSALVAGRPCLGGRGAVDPCAGGVIGGCTSHGGESASRVRQPDRRSPNAVEGAGDST